MCDVTGKEVLGIDFWEHECKQTMAVCIIFAVCVWKNIKKGGKNNIDLSFVL